MTTKITELTEPHRGWRFHSGATIYTERLRDGRLLAASFQASGVPCFPSEEESATPAFDLQIDGDSLAFGWELIESTVTATDAQSPSARVLLRHTLKPIEIEILTSAGGHGFFRRRLQLRNTSENATLGLTSVTPLAGALWLMTDNLRENLHDSGGMPYRVGWMQENEWGYEGNFQWHDVPLNTELAFGSRRGKSGYGTPFAVAQNNVYGDFLVLSLAWSANWRMSFHCDYSRLTGAGKLLFDLQPTGPAPMRLLAPGETVTLPDVHFGMNHVSLDDAIQGWHAYLRRHVLSRVGDGLQPVIYNTWGYAEHELSEASLKSEIDIAAEIGAELFTIDSGWYADVNTPWFETSGDWQIGNRLPNDLFPVFEYARSKGLKCGLWAEIESAGKLSKLTQEHPDWFIERYGKRIERILDLTKPAVRNYIEGHIVRLIERYQLDLFRLDYNLDAGEGGFNLKEGHQENTLWRHVEVIQEIFDRVRTRYPNLLLQNCSGGGGRNDLGMLSRFNTTQASDWMKMPRAVRILNGMSMALPPEIIDRWLGVAVHHKIAGNLSMQLHSIILCHPVVSDFAQNLADANPEVLRVTKKYLAIYRDFIRPFHREARVYHHTPVIPGADASGWCALELVAPDRRRAVAGVFRLVNADRDDYCLRLRGLDPGRRYRVTIEPGGMDRLLDGHTLSEQGLTLRLDTPLTSRLVLCEATD